MASRVLGRRASGMTQEEAKVVVSLQGTFWVLRGGSFPKDQPSLSRFFWGSFQEGLFK